MLPDYYICGRGWEMKSLGVWIFFGSGANGFHDEPGLVDETPLVLLLLFEQRQPTLSDTTARHVKNRTQQRRNQRTAAFTA